MAEPRIVAVMRELKAGLLARDGELIAEMAGRWLGVEQALESQVMALALEIERLREAGEVIQSSKLGRLERYRELVGQAKVEVEQYSRWADDLTKTRTYDAALHGLNDAGLGIETVRAEASLTVRWAKLPTAAIENLIGVAQDGSPLAELLKASYPEAVQGLTNSLLAGLAQGVSPVTTARMMRDGFGMGFDRALTIARNETLRAYREASRMQYEASEIVTRYMRMSAKDRRVCMGCLMADGTIYTVETAFEEHVCGRCTIVPMLGGKRLPGYVNGEKWFRGLEPDLQREMMGGRYYEAWKDGQFELKQLVKHVENETWGNSIAVTPLRELAS